jgi:hypothetical protein
MRVLNLEEMLNVSGGSGGAGKSKKSGKGSGKKSGKGSCKSSGKGSGKGSGKDSGKVCLPPAPIAPPAP